MGCNLRSDPVMESETVARLSELPMTQTIP